MEEKKVAEDDNSQGSKERIQNIHDKDKETEPGKEDGEDHVYVKKVNFDYLEINDENSKYFLLKICKVMIK